MDAPRAAPDLQSLEDVDWVHIGDYPNGHLLVNNTRVCEVPPGKWYCHGRWGFCERCGKWLWDS